MRSTKRFLGETKAPPCKDAALAKPNPRSGSLLPFRHTLGFETYFRGSEISEVPKYP